MNINSECVCAVWTFMDYLFVFLGLVQDTHIQSVSDTAVGEHLVTISHTDDQW